MKYIKYPFLIVALSLFLMGCNTGIKATPVSGTVPEEGGAGTALTPETEGGAPGTSTSSPPVSAPDFAGRTLVVRIVGNGTVSGPDLSCHAAECVKSYELGSFVSLDATPDAHYTFSGWGGECSGTDPAACLVSMGNDKFVTATFVPETLTSTPTPKTLRITFTGPAAAGRVTSLDGSIDCLTSVPDCSQTYLPIGTATTVSVTLNKPEADSGYSFIGWGGSCAGLDACTVVLTADITEVIANFSGAHSLKVGIDSTGTGTGVVRMNAALGSLVLPEYVCPPDCMEYYPVNSDMTLTAEPASGSIFDIWEDGPCAVPGMETNRICTFNLDSDKAITAKFKVITITPGFTRPSIKEGIGPRVPVPPGTF